MIDLFLIILAGIWLAIASIFDLKKREVPNWLSFSLVIFALGYRLIYSVLNSDYSFFTYGLMGFAIFYVLANVFYYGRIFAGGDAKLLMGLGAVLPSFSSFSGNLFSLAFFIFLLIAVGGAYGLLYSVFVAFINKKKFVIEFGSQLKKRKGLIFIFFIFAVFSLLIFFYRRDNLLLFVPAFLAVFPFLFIYAKALENCMIITIDSGKVTVGDWLYESVILGKKKIKPYWEGLSEEEVKLIRKFKKKVKIKQGIPFVPSFFFAFLAFLYLRESFWSFFQLFWFF